MSDNELREIPNVRQREGEDKRRWFTCAQMDVYLWEKPDTQITAFQITYDIPTAEKAISWKLAEGINSSSVMNNGPVAGRHPGTPLLVTTHGIDGWYVCGLLRKYHGDLPSSAWSIIGSVIANAYGNITSGEPFQNTQG